MTGLHLDILLVLGIALSGGILGAWFFQKLHIPQVIGYIAIGLLIGRSGLGIVSYEHFKSFQPANLFALGIIGFLVGGELKLEIFRKYAGQFTAILLGEGLAAFLLVGISSTVLLYYVTHTWAPALAGGIVLGAIASATDPASTVDVLWEYRSRGVLTTSLIAIVALDDALAMTLYGLGSSAAEILSGGMGALGHEVARVTLELGGAIALGALFGYMLSLLLRRVKEPEKGQAIAISIILLDIGISRALDFDVILSAMTVGFVLTNRAPRRSKDLFRLIRNFSLPIYVFFFVLVGARLGLAQMPTWLWGIVGVYVVGRTLGKISGAYFGARLMGADAAVRRYLGMGLFAQGGVAIGLSIMASEHLGMTQVTDSMSLSQVIVFSVTATTLIVQIIGPPMVKLAITLAGESGRNVTKEDVIASWKVKDVMYPSVVALAQETSVSAAIKTFAQHDFLSYPVVDGQHHVVGMISLDEMKEILAEQGTWNWMVVADVMSPARDKVLPEMPLSDARELMQKLKLDRMPVVNSFEEGKLVGILSFRHAETRIAHEVIVRQGSAVKRVETMA